MSKWKKIKLGDLGEIITGNTPKTGDIRNYESNDISFIKPSDFKEYCLNLISDSEYYISNYAKENARIIPPNSVMVTCIGTIGKVGINSIEASFNQQINAIIPNNSKINSKFLGYSILNINAQLNNIANAPVVPIINKKQFSNIEIAIPNLEEQLRIVNILDKVNNLITLRKKQIEELDNLIQSIFYDMFGDPVTNSKGWKLKKLSDLGTLGRGVSKHRPRNAPELLGGIHPLIQTGDVSNSNLFLKSFNSTYSDLGLQQSKKWEKGTLCITIAANIAKTAILDFDACFPDSLVGFISNENSNNIFVYYWFGFFQQILEKQAPESAQKNINLKILNDLNIITPPIELQNKFADYVLKIEEKKSLLEQSLEKMELNYKSLMQRAFNGTLFE